MIEMRRELIHQASSYIVESRELGKHLILEIWGCNPEQLKNVEEMSNLLRKIARKCNMQVLGEVSTKFVAKGEGCSVVLLLAESHISVHTWPEHGYAAIDIFTCGRKDPIEALGVIKEFLNPSQVCILRMKRGTSPTESLEWIKWEGDS